MYEKYKYHILGCVSLVTVFMLGLFWYLIYHNCIQPKQVILNALNTIDIGVQVPETHYIPESHYFSEIPTASTPKETFGVEEVFTSSYIETELSSFDEKTPDISDVNKALFDLADRNFQVYYGSTRLSPIVPMAIANVETPGRADHNKTWSALFPSKYVPIELMYSMDVTTVVSSEDIFRPLSTEYSTRDRGALQMSPTYGTGNAYFNNLMSQPESEKLANLNSSQYAVWASGASTKRGDRFSVSDVCLRLSAAFTDAIERMSKNNYIPNNDYQLLAMCAMYHQQSGVWSNANHASAVGKWKSGEKALEYSSLISSKEFLNALKNYAYDNPDVYCISNDALAKIYKANTDSPMSEFATSTLVTNYPIKVEFAYIKLCIMYGRRQ